MSARDLAQETNPIDRGMLDLIWRAMDHVDWTDPKLARIVRLRLLTDPGYPEWDVSYCVGILKNGTAVHVTLPFDQLPRKHMRRAIVLHAKRDGVYAAGLRIFDAISTLI